jgi:putative transposase
MHPGMAILFRLAQTVSRYNLGIERSLPRWPNGAGIGFLAIPHSWGQNLPHHPHGHCVVPGGGISPDGSRWIGCRSFLPVRVLSRLFRRLFLEALHKRFEAGELQFFSSIEALREKAAFAAYLAAAGELERVVYAKAPFGGPTQVLRYLGRYTHRMAISHNRPLSFEDGRVRFLWKDYQHDGVPYSNIALWLGHESATTTHRYAEANPAMKEKALTRP